ncbi:MAG: fibronectin type III domain-containing protein, partial [Acidobacteria bacterium]|nr:fibronectin type III domain-containing protein [Acidobacteriota bacterium]
MRRFVTLLFVLPLLTVVFATNADAANLTLEWDSPTDASTVGHVILYGTTSGAYALKVDVGRATTASISGLSDGVRYCFAVLAYNSGGTLSERSSEVCGSTPPAPSAPVVTAPPPP